MRAETSMDVMGVRKAFGLPASGVWESPKPEALASLLYILVMVKVPFPVQPPLPLSVQVPEMVLPFALPERVSLFPDGSPDCTVKPNCPVTVPLKLPLSVNEPLSVSPETKHGEFVVN